MQQRRDMEPAANSVSIRAVLPVQRLACCDGGIGAHARDGVLVVNTGPSRRYGEQLRALIARTTAKPVTAVIHLNLHPDYFLGSQAFADVPRYATQATLEGMRAEARAYEDNLYRLCGDWMKGTEALLPDRVLAPGDTIALAGRQIAVREFKGHTASDLVLRDEADADTRARFVNLAFKEYMAAVNSYTP